MDSTYIDSLLHNLKHEEETVRESATQELWRIWFEQKGVVGYQVLQRAQILLQAGEFNQAESILTQLISSMPDFAEAWNRRAVLYFTQQRYDKAILDCQQVIQLNSSHFGALHGLGLCHVAIEDYHQAIHVFRAALTIHPYSLENQRMLLECTLKLT
ncbi:tetratricopeptide repeat protein [Alkalinema pantanalense CENA528]|uniref:tetratricopeptide repeat protein n=1 Tax=Alkalinema pantanalense TaxID=1620705 RepID=UPI003D6ECDD7